MQTTPTDGIGVIRAAGQAAVALQATRRTLLSQLAEPDSAAGLARRLGVPRQRLNYHLRALERQGLVECVAERRKGNCTERIFRTTARSFVISPEALGPALDADAVADRFSASYLLATAAQTLRDVAALDARARAERKHIATLSLTVDVRFASAAARAAFAEELSGAVASLAARYHDEKASEGRRFRLVALLHPAVPGRASKHREEPSCPTPSQPSTRATGRSKWRSTSTRRRKTSGGR